MDGFIRIGFACKIVDWIRYAVSTSVQLQGTEGISWGAAFKIAKMFHHDEISLSFTESCDKITAELLKQSYILTWWPKIPFPPSVI